MIFEILHAIVLGALQWVISPFAMLFELVIDPIVNWVKRNF